jgi:hypothetical protein
MNAKFRIGIRNKRQVPVTYKYRKSPNLGHYQNFGHLWLFYILYHNFEMRHYFNYVKVGKNS